MKVISLISQKGGAGKSTLACHLAILAGEEGPAYILDRDPQQTSAKFLGRRQALEPAPEQPQLLDLGSRSLTAAVEALRAREGTLVIDTRPAVAQPESEAAKVSDVVIVPVRPSPNDLEAVVDTLSMLKALNRRALLVVNAVRSKQRAVEAKAALSRFNVPTCPVTITDRTIFYDAAIQGRGALEVRGHGAREAAEEVRAVWQWIKEEADV